MKKRIICLALAALFCLTLASCATSSPSANPGGSNNSPVGNNNSPAGNENPAAKVEITVVSSYGGDDGNRANYEAAVAEYEAATGNTVINDATSSDETWKARVRTDFETGAEPDVLFFFAGADADAFVLADKVVPIEEIRTVYSDYGSNMKDDILNTTLASPANGKAYVLPMNGYWETMFYNSEILADNGVTLPKTWDEFLAACETLKTAGITPIAMSVSEVPHYWWEFALMNNAGMENHMVAPKEKGDDAYNAYVQTLKDIKDLYDKGYFPENALTILHAEADMLFSEKKAAFFADGSWAVNSILEHCEAAGTDPDQVKFMGTPTKDASKRPANSYVSGISMGFYITRKAWDDPDKREAAVKFVQHLTSDEIVSKFAGFSSTATKNPVVMADAKPIQQNAIDFIASGEGFVPAAQDTWNADAKGDLFKNVQFVCAGEMTPEEAVDSFLALNK